MKPVIRVKEGTEKGYAEAYLYDGLDLQYANSTTRRGRVQSQMAHSLTGGDYEYVVVPYKTNGSS